MATINNNRFCCCTLRPKNSPVRQLGWMASNSIRSRSSENSASHPAQSSAAPCCRVTRCPRPALSVYLLFIAPSLCLFRIPATYLDRFPGEFMRVFIHQNLQRRLLLQIVFSLLSFVVCATP